jgi:hypothetical protein
MAEKWLYHRQRIASDTIRVGEGIGVAGFEHPLLKRAVKRPVTQWAWTRVKHNERAKHQ